MQRSYFGCLMLLVLLGFVAHPVFAAGCAEACGYEVTDSVTGDKTIEGCGGCCANGGCTAACAKGICAWSNANGCTNWCDNGGCYYDGTLGTYLKNQVCCVGHPYDTRVVDCNAGGLLRILPKIVAGR